MPRSFNPLVPEAGFDTKECPLVVAALVASEIATPAGMKRYLSLFEELERQISQDMPQGDEVARAKYLFRWLWQTKPRRYQPGGSFRLTEVLEAQLAPGPGPVGNCLGLTVLYNTLAQKLGLQVTAIHLERAPIHRGAPHVFTRLLAPDGPLDIENILPDGFDYPGHRQEPGRERWGDRELVADIYLSQGNSLFEAKGWREAIACYDMALKLNPNYEKAELNRAMARSQL